MYNVIQKKEMILHYRHRRCIALWCI